MDNWAQIVENAEVLAYPEDEVLRLYQQKREVYEYYAEDMGTSYEIFLSTFLNTTDEKIMEESRAYVKEDLVMYQLVKDLGVEVTDEEYQKGLEFFARYHGMTPEDFESYYGKDTIRTSVIWQELMDVIAEFSVITEE